MPRIPRVKAYFRVLRGTVENLEGSQSFPLTSWARFELGYTTVLVHDLFLLPPRLSDGDEVVVAGQLSQGRFEALACHKPDEPEEEYNRRKLAERRRKTVWTSLFAACLLIPWLWVLFASPSRALLAAPLLLGPVVAWNAKSVNLWAAETELALALAEGRVESADATLGPSGEPETA